MFTPPRFISSDRTLKKSIPSAMDMRASMAVSILFLSIILYIVERLHPSSLASQPAERFCRSSSSFMICPMFTILPNIRFRN